MTDDRTTVPVSVLLADDHRLVRVGMAALLADGDEFAVVGQADDGEQAVHQALATRPDVVLMDLSMPVLDGVEATRRIHAALPQTHVVVLTSFSDRDRVRAAMNAGAIGYLLKDCDPRDLRSGVRAAARGQSPLDPRVAATLLPGAGHDGAAQLSTREREVLALVCQGLANKQIARTLAITERTVKVHLGNVYRRIGVGDRTSAALWARDHLGFGAPAPFPSI